MKNTNSQGKKPGQSFPQDFGCGKTQFGNDWVLLLHNVSPFADDMSNPGGSGISNWPGFDNSDRVPDSAGDWVRGYN